MSGAMLSQEQLEAAKCGYDRLMIVAPPGCGKTEVLAHRAAHQIESLQKNQRVLALTFTNRARSNIEERLRSVLGQAKMQRYVVVRNFHGLAADIVLSHGRTTGLDVENLRLPKSSTLRKAMEAAGAYGSVMYRAEDILAAVKRNAYSDSEILAALQEYPSNLAREVAVQVERSRQNRNDLHYDDVLRHAQLLLRIPAVARLYQSHYGAVLVDEFQDLSLQQYEIAQLTCASRQTFAGDSLQGIYSWAGAAPTDVETSILQKSEYQIRLHESYRSSPKVLAAVNSVSEQINSEAKLTSAQPDRWVERGCSASIVLEDREMEAAIVQRLSAIILKCDAEKSIGIICRAAWRRKQLDQAFGEEKRFPVRRWDLAIEDPTVVTHIQSVVAALPRGASIEEARLSALDAVDFADVEMREQIDDAFSVLEQSGASTAKAAVRSIRVSDPKQTIGPGPYLSDWL